MSNAETTVPRSIVGRAATLPLRGMPVRDLGIIVVFAGLFLALTLASPVFLTRHNLVNILDQAAPVGIIAVGATVIIIAGGFDLSAGAVYALAAVVGAKLLADAGLVAGLLAGVGVGLAAGALNGFLVGGLKINALLATLGTGLAFGGLATIVTDGFQVPIEDDRFLRLGQGTWLGLSWPTWFFIAATVAAAALLGRTRFGRHVYAVGGNPEAARLSGIRVGRVVALTFAFGGALAAIAGSLASAKVGLAQAGSGVGLELQAIAAVFVGGTSINGGEGAVWRTVLGVLILALIQNGFNLLNLAPELQPVVQGAIIVTAVGIESWTRRTTP